MNIHLFSSLPVSAPLITLLMLYTCPIMAYVVFLLLSPSVSTVVYWGTLLLYTTFLAFLFLLIPDILTSYLVCWFPGTLYCGFRFWHSYNDNSMWSDILWSSIYLLINDSWILDSTIVDLNNISLKAYSCVLLLVDIDRILFALSILFIDIDVIIISNCTNR